MNALTAKESHALLLALSPERQAMKPNPDDLDQSTTYFNQLCRDIGRPLGWISRNSGISRRRLLYLQVGTRTVNGVSQPVKLNYCEQFCLECLAETTKLPA